MPMKTYSESQINRVAEKFGRRFIVFANLWEVERAADDDEELAIMRHLRAEFLKGSFRVG